MNKNIQREATICKFELISLALKNKFEDDASKIEFTKKCTKWLSEKTKSNV